MTKKTNVELMNFESNVQMVKYDVLKEVAKLAFQGALNEKLLDIPKKIVPGPKPITRCCIYHEREVIKDRVKLAMGGDKENDNIIEVIESACDECPVYRYFVTEACRGCISHKCQQACPFGAITITNHRAHINQELCKECGRCREACPYNAIADVKRPCIKACEAKALKINDDKKAEIDNDKCVQCGSCAKACPFGAIMDKSNIVDVINLIKASKENGNNVYAVIAPAISSQFTYATIGQVVTAIKTLGFTDVVEAALGADIVAEHESKEFGHVVAEQELMTTSCCPAFLLYIKKNYPELMEMVSTSVSPMVASARLIKKTDENAKVIFIGPCMAKKMEAKQGDIDDAVEYVLTFEELLSLLDAADIQVGECEESRLDNASYFGRIFARSGGVTEAITQAVQEFNLDVDFKPIKCNGLKECDMNLKLAKLKRAKGNFIEGMACSGGCIGGPAAVNRGPSPKNVKAVDSYGKLAYEKTIQDSIDVFKSNIEEVNLERDYNKAF